MQRKALKRVFSMLMVITVLCSSVAVVLAAEENKNDLLTNEEIIFADEGKFVLGNSSQNVLNGGVIAEKDNKFYYVQDNNLWESIDGIDNIILNENVKNINLSHDKIYYSIDNLIKCFDFSTNETHAVFKANADIKMMYLINDKYLYFLSDGNILCYNICGSKVCEITENLFIKSFIPTKYGLLYATGSLFDYTVYVNGKEILNDVAEYYTTEELLVYTKSREIFQVNLSDVFLDFNISDVKPLQFEEEVELFSDNYNSEDNLEYVAIIDESYAMEIEEDEMSCPTVLFSAGAENVIKRARQQLEIKWTPQKDVRGFSSGGNTGNATVFKAGTTYSGVPYGQPINSGRYVPHNYSLTNFISAVNDKTSVFYTSRGSYTTYSMDSPYYASDCSAFVSWAYGMNRKTTSSIVNVTDKVSTQSVYSAKVGDCLNKQGSHVVLISDLIYDSNGNLTKVTIIEQTPPKAKKTTYAVATITSKYLNNGYVLRRYSGIDSVSYTHYCVVPIDGDSCASCNAGKSVTMSFDANGGSGTISPLMVEFNSDFTFPECTFEKEGYHFTGWHAKRGDGTWYALGQGWFTDSEIEANGYTIKEYLPGQTLTFNASWTKGSDYLYDYTFYANWVPNTYTIVYDGNGATGGATESSVHTYDEASRLTANGFTRDGYTFGAWAVKTDDGALKISYYNTQSVKNLTSEDGGVVTLYAFWKKNAVDVTGITIDKENLVLTVGETSTITATVLPEGAIATVEWASSDTSVASVENGVVTALSEGEAVIVAMSESGEFQVTCNVTVLPKHDYTVITIKGEVIDGVFYAETEVLKNTDRDNMDMIVIAVYKGDIMLDMVYMKANIDKDETVRFGGILEGIEDATLKAFVWDSLTSMTALSNVIEK